MGGSIRRETVPRAPARVGPPTAFADAELAREPDGAVARCACCGGLVVGFGGAQVTLSEAEAAQMVRALGGLARAGGAAVLRVRTARESATFTLWDGDAARVLGLLEHALAVVRMDAVLVERLGARA